MTPERLAELEIEAEETARKMFLTDCPHVKERHPWLVYLPRQNGCVQCVAGVMLDLIAEVKRLQADYSLMCDEEARLNRELAWLLAEHREAQHPAGPCEAFPQLCSRPR